MEMIDKINGAFDFIQNVNLVQYFKEKYGVNFKNVTDGYHTFDELYYHRMIMSSIIFEMYSDYAWKSWKHADETMFDDSFIVGVTIPNVGDYSYHYHAENWDMFKVKEVEFAPEYDGHKPSDIGRLLELSKLK